MNQRMKLEFQADRIEAVLAVHELPARVTGGTVTPRWVRFQVLPAVGAKISEIKGLHVELAAALDAPTCRVSRRGAAVAIEVPRNDPQSVRLLPLYQQLIEQEPQFPPVTAILGLAEDGAPLLIRLPSPDVAHILVAGANGAGKTTLLYSIVASLALAGEPDEIAFCFLGDIAAAMAEAVGKMGFQATTDTTTDTKWSVIVTGAVRAAEKHVVIVADDITGQATVASGLARVIGYKKLHFILAWDGVPPKKIVNLFKVRLVGRVSSVEDARMASGWLGTGAERLMGQGDFLAVAEGRMHRFQAAYVSKEEVQELAEVKRLGATEGGTDKRMQGLSLPWPAGRLTEMFDEG